MELSLIKNFIELCNYIKNPFYRNSLYIALGRIADVGFGFVFWTVAARLYSITDIGIATALTSSLGLVMAFSRFGFDTAIIRFMPNRDRRMVFNTTLWVTTVAALLVGIFYLVLITSISPDIAFLQDYSSLFILFVLANTATLTISNTFLSLRRADLRLIQNIIMGGRVLLLIPFVGLGALGIFSSMGFAYIVSAALALILVQKFLPIHFEISKSYLKDTFQFSIFNYMAGLLQTLPTLVLPLLILNLLGPDDAALYFIAFAIGNLVLIIPDAMTTSFFVEGSHGINLRRAAMRTIRITYFLLIPIVLFIFFYGDSLLALFGPNYLNAFSLLRILCISAIFVTIFNLFIPIQNIRLQVQGVVLINLIKCVLLLGFSYLFLIHFGVIGAGYAWLLVYVILTGGILLIVKGKGWI